MNFYISTNYEDISYETDNSLLFHSELVTRKFYFYLLFNSKILFFSFELVTRKFYFNSLFRVSNSKILIYLFNLTSRIL